MKAKYQYKSERLENKSINNVDGLLNKYAQKGFEFVCVNGHLFFFKKQIETRGRKKKVTKG